HRQPRRPLEQRPAFLALGQPVHQRAAVRRYRSHLCQLPVNMDTPLKSTSTAIDHRTAHLSPLTSHRFRLTLHRESVEPALGFPRAAPAPGALRLARGGGPGARPAPDARVALIEERVVGNAVLSDVAPHVGPAPAREWEHFQDRPPGDLVVLEQLRRRAGGGPPRRPRRSSRSGPPFPETLRRPT